MPSRDPVTGRFLAGSGEYMDKAGYVRVYANGTERKQHDLVWEAANGPIPPGFDVHHKNEDKADNRLENLELVEHGKHSAAHTAGRIRSAETRARISQAKRGNVPWNKGQPGYKVSPHKAPPSPETRAKLSAALKGRQAWNTGKPWSEATRARISLAHKGKRPSPATEFKKGEHRSPSTEFKAGRTVSPEERAKLSQSHLAKGR